VTQDDERGASGSPSSIREEGMMTHVTDFFLAVYLLAMGEEMIELQVRPEEVFRFADSPTLQEYITAYRENTALVNPKSFAREIMALRQRLHRHHASISC
jgi:hypothetical protein